jgi:TolB-like protein/DNA-binding winged helix-turn-helix (wHTH) protein/tetratricopeptide (TPR) repeat protein
VGTDLRVGAWLVRPTLNTVSRNGTSIHLEPKVMEVLVTLASQPGEAVPKDQLLKTVWPDTFVTDDVLIRSISELRRVFEDDAREPHIIETIPKRGYRLVATVEPANGETGRSDALEGSRADSAAGKGTRNRWLRVGAYAGATLLLVLLIASWKVQRWRSAGSNFNRIHSLAVLPLQNLSPDPAQEYFSDGMTDALITDLAQIGSLKVISRTSSMQYKQTKKSLPEIARELNVDGIVEGTVQRSGDRVRITARLIQSSTDKHLWANSYERDTRDVFTLEREVTADIARQVQAKVTAQDQVTPAQPRPVNPDALEAYLQGSYHLNSFGKGFGDEEKRKAAGYFQQAIAADPNFAAAYNGMANAHYELLWPSTQDAEIATKAAERAVELDSNSSDAQCTLGEIRIGTGDFRGAEEQYRRALALSPSNANAHDGFSFWLGAMGRLDEALSEAKIAQQLDPSGNHLPLALYQLRDYDRAIVASRTLLQSDPDNGYFHWDLSRSYAAKGMYKDSITELEKSVSQFGLPEIANRIHRAFMISGYRGARQRYAKELESLIAAKQAYRPVDLGETYADLGNKDRAFFWLEEAYQHRDLHWTAMDLALEWINAEPMLDSLRSDVRYKDLVRRVGLPP